MQQTRQFVRFRWQWNRIVDGIRSSMVPRSKRHTALNTWNKNYYWSTMWKRTISRKLHNQPKINNIIEAESIDKRAMLKLHTWYCAVLNDRGAYLSFKSNMNAILLTRCQDKQRDERELYVVDGRWMHTLDARWNENRENDDDDDEGNSARYECNFLCTRICFFSLFFSF